MSDCDRTRCLVGPYLFADLQGEEITFVESHLAGCPACSADFAAVESALALVPPDALKPSDETRARILAAAERLTARPHRFAPRWLPTWGLAAAALVLGVVVGYQLPRGPVQSPDSLAPPAISSIAATRAVPAPSIDVGSGEQGSTETASASADMEAKMTVTPNRHSGDVRPQTGSSERRSGARGGAWEAIVQTRPVLRPPRPLGIDDVRVAEAVQLEVVR